MDQSCGEGFYGSSEIGVGFGALVLEGREEERV